MSKIYLMKPELANLIAAGEVIERPASVVKELCENSIDAGAKNIYIGITDAGKGTILVKDDGSGMDKDDAKMCFLRHASSKIRTEYDLNRIHTLGFRGEAIPSIAAVSKVTLTTSTGEGAGTRVESVPNEDLVIREAPSRKGSIFEVRDLFFNTPARLKYLRSAQVETYAIIEMAEHLALGFHGVSFSLAIDGKEIFRTSGRGDLLETVQKIYGNVIAQSLYPVLYEGVAFSFRGYISKPEINYSRRKDMLTFLNHRCIYDYKINKAMEEAYKDYLPPSRYPFTLLELDLDSSLVDVNVHPTKKEVRISVEDDIAKEVKNEVLSVLEKRKPIYFASQDEKSLSLNKDSSVGKEESDLFDTSTLTEKEKEAEETQVDYSAVKPLVPERKTTYFQDSLPFAPTYEAYVPSGRDINSKKEETKPAEPVSAPSVPTTPIESAQKAEETVSSTAESNSTKKDIPQEGIEDVFNEPVHTEEEYYNNIFKKEEISYKLPEMHPIGQVLKTYLICDGIDCFYILDQHAAAERINYEKTEALFASVRSRIVPLFPILIELSPKEKINYDDEHKARLASLSIITEEFGDNTIKVSEIPSFLSERGEEAIISDTVHACLNDEEADPLGLLHLTIANIACKKSIKANHDMSVPEMEALISDLSKCRNPANCPHGRPTIIKVTRADIEKIFRRSGF